ncbi:activator of Hsp90 ATPase 1 family protein [Oceanobacillus picturae]|uniref:Activator of Hsp90 ATPase 1 family protein n=1 Tax=Oceanobacillus picturae TaxID=171693 RepID=A0A0U9HBF5_9BACI|nr:SRPBCC family protein [Oceanobacillus picturae]RIU91136.1 activator of Hsp90 ATPase 1 family protein [Oceanobacillus picturae]GAQ19887.1 activator of Hsp90 ATPase 1 family protein [Oceanobacillus picturae]
MIAEVEKIDGAYIVIYKRPLTHSVDKVWRALTENDKLEKWMPNLEVKNLQQDGVIQFNMNDRTDNSFNMKILDYKEYTYLQYEWGEGWVRFELYPQAEGCLLLLKEFNPTLNDHTPKDLAGWHVCLEMFMALLEGKMMDFPKDDWEVWYEKYSRVIRNVKK